MQRPIPWVWIVALLAILLLPSPVGRVLIDVIGGLTLLLLLLPLLVGGAAFIGWQLVRRRLRTCTTCGMTSFGTEICPACGTPLTGEVAEGTPSRRREMPQDLDPRNVTITVDAVEIEDGEDSGP